MTLSDRVKQLVESHQAGDDAAFLQAAESLIRDERRLRHDTVADDLEKILARRPSSRPLNVSTLRALPTTRDDSPLLNLEQPQYTMRDLVLHPRTKSIIDEVIGEFRNRSILAAHGLEPRSRLLFVGPPGCGKSVTAEAIASDLGIPLARVQLASLVSSFLGETSRNLEQILDFCRSGSWVLLFDELDMLAKERSDTSEHGELKRVVATFLQLLDGFESDSIVIATSNHPSLLDDAVWRRFHEVVVFDLPTQRETAKLIGVKLRSMRTKFPRDKAARLLRGASHADVEMACYDAARRAVLAGREAIEWSDMQRGIQELSRRRSEVSRFRTRDHSSETDKPNSSDT